RRRGRGRLRTVGGRSRLLVLGHPGSPWCSVLVRRAARGGCRCCGWLVVGRAAVGRGGHEKTPRPGRLEGWAQARPGWGGAGPRLAEYEKDRLHVGQPTRS